MARENRQTRDRKRFGEPQLLADRIHELDTVVRAEIPHELSGECHKRAIAIFAEVSAATVITADAVVEYFFAVHGGSTFDWRRDIPCWRPPFKRIFIECKRPPSYVPGQRFPSYFPVRWGWLINETTPTDALVASVHSRPGFRDAKVHAVLRANLIEELPNRKTHVDVCTIVLPIDYDGQLLGDPRLEISEKIANTDAATHQMSSNARFLAAPVLLSLAFMNCQNVTLTTVDADKSFNRERKRHDRRPLVDYRTIDIEPFKVILKTEGRVDEVGLAEALHQVRGHFVNYSKERPMFGKLSGRFWVPPHARGSAENGTIIADYRVNKPA